MLIGVLAAFCIMAVIEIIHGQNQVRAEREKRALAEENRELAEKIQELTEAQGDLNDENAGQKDSGTDGAADQGENADPVSDHSVSANSASAQDGDHETDGDGEDSAMQIVFMGDSILADESENGGVAALVAQACNARVYNMAIGGTTAALLPDEAFDFNNWTSVSFLGVVQAALGNIGTDVFEGYKAKEVMDECDFSKTDYFVVNYGINDFLCRQVARSKYLENGDVLDIKSEYTYVGALEIGVVNLLDNFPDAKVILISPHYCEIFEGDKYIGNSYTLDYGCGTLVDYCGLCSYVALQHEKDGVIFFNGMGEDCGIDAYSVTDYLVDGIHLSAQGCQRYSDCISRRILADFYREE